MFSQYTFPSINYKIHALSGFLNHCRPLGSFSRRQNDVFFFVFVFFFCFFFVVVVVVFSYFFQNMGLTFHSNCLISFFFKKVGLNISYKLSPITKTYLYNFDPIKPHFYIVKLGFTGVYISFLISAQKHKLWILVRTASSSFDQKYEKYQNFYLKTFSFFLWWNFQYIWIGVFS